jgi:hypothetical protein
MSAGDRLVGTIHEISPPARSANAAMAAEETDADALANFPTLHASAERVDCPDDFMTGYARKGDAWHEAIDGERVGMADAAGFDPKADPASRRINERTLHELHFSRRSDLKGAISGHRGRFLSGFQSSVDN